MTIRTRFAPSPTGFLHVGGVRTALFAWLLARQAHGQFVLRLEDTDQKREVEGSAEHLMTSLQALGINYDEGPDIGGPFAPYRQSDRLAIYRKWAQKLIDSGRAYADPYAPEELQSFRDRAKLEKKAFLYREHRPENPPAWDGMTPLRFKSDPKAYAWHDAVMGDLRTGPEVIDDFILIKSDGFPTYNFAHIVDDAEMEITHIIRGQEFISSQPNYLNLYEALGFDMTSAKHERSARASGEGDEAMNSLHSESGGRALPIFATMPHIMAESGNKKLGKRDGAKDVLDYLKDGYIPEALVNFIASLGWNDGTEQEIFTRDELIAKFSLDRVQRSGARFDEQRLLWLNGQHIRLLSLDDLYERVSGQVSSSHLQTDSETTPARVARGEAAPTSTSGEVGADRATGPATSELRENNEVIFDDASDHDDFWPEAAKEASKDKKKQILALVQDRLKTLKDLPTLTQYFFAEPTPDWNMVNDNKQLKKFYRLELVDLLDQAKIALKQSDFDADTVQDTLNQLLETTGQKPGILFSLIRLAVSWAPFSPALNDTLATLGKEKTLQRLQKAIEAASV